MELRGVGWSPVHTNPVSGTMPHQAFSFHRALLKSFGGYDFQIDFPLSDSPPALTLCMDDATLAGEHFGHTAF